MDDSAKEIAQIEALRRQIHAGFGAQYDPARLQQLVPISQELDRLVVAVTRTQESLRDAREQR